MKRDRNLSDLIAWLVFSGMLFWLILNFFGLIKSFIFDEYLFYFGVFYLTGWAIHKLILAVNITEELQRFRLETIKEVNKLKIKSFSNRVDKKQ